MLYVQFLTSGLNQHLSIISLPLHFSFLTKQNIIVRIFHIERFLYLPNSVFYHNLITSFRTRSPPALTRKLSREALEAHDQVMNSNEVGGGVAVAGGAGGTGGGDGIVGLSRTSALNNRYFDDKAKSRSLDNLLEGPPNMQVCGVQFMYRNWERYDVKIDK